MLEGLEASVGEDAYGSRRTTHHLAHRARVEADDHPQEDGLGLVGRQRRDEAERPLGALAVDDLVGRVGRGAVVLAAGPRWVRPAGGLAPS